MALSNQLRNISRGIRAQADQQQAAGNAQAGVQTQQQIGQAAAIPQANIKQAGSQLAAQSTAAQGQAALEAQQSESELEQPIKYESW